MTTTELIDQIRAKAMAMPKAERAELAEALFAVGAELEDVDAEDAGLHPEWHAEIARRVASIDDGTDVGIPADQAIAEVRAKFGW